MKWLGPCNGVDWAIRKCSVQSGMSITSTVAFMDVRAKMFYLIYFLQISLRKDNELLVSEVKKMGVMDFISEINYYDDSLMGKSLCTRYNYFKQSFWFVIRLFRETTWKLRVAVYKQFKGRSTCTNMSLFPVLFLILYWKLLPCYLYRDTFCLYRLEPRFIPREILQHITYIEASNVLAHCLCFQPHEKGDFISKISNDVNLLNLHTLIVRV